MTKDWRNQQVEARLRRLLATKLYLDVTEADIGLDDGLRDVLGLDSLGFVELRSLIEEMFSVSIADEQFSPAHFASVRALTVLVDQLRADA